MTIGEAIKKRIFELCDERGISVNQWCTDSGVSQSTVNNLTGGRNNSMTAATIQKLCDGMGITIDDFFHSELFRGLEQELK